MAMAEATKAFSAPAGVLRTRLTRIASAVCNSGACCNRDDLFSQIPALACYVYLHTALLFRPGCLYRPGRAARVPEGAQPQVELPRSTVFRPAFLPISILC